MPSKPPVDPVVALRAILSAVKVSAVRDSLRKALPPPVHDLDGILVALSLLLSEVELRPPPARPQPPLTARKIKAMPLREVPTEEERIRRRDLVVLVGQALYGAAWQTPLARALSEAGGRPMTQNRIAHWLHDGVQARPVPGWVLPALRKVAMDGIERIRRNIAVVDACYAGRDDAEVVARGTVWLP